MIDKDAELVEKTDFRLQIRVPNYLYCESSANDVYLFKPRFRDNFDETLSIYILEQNDVGMMYFKQQTELLRAPGFADSVTLKWKIIRSGPSSVIKGATELIAELKNIRKQVTSYSWQAVGMAEGRIFKVELSAYGSFRSDESVWGKVFGSLAILSE